MFNKSLSFGMAAVALVSFSAPAFAADPETRVLRIPAGLCEGFKQELIRWAATTGGHAAYAVPVQPRGANYSCDNPGPSVPAAYSFNYGTQPPANKRAVDDCNVTRPDGFRNCVVVGKAFPQSSR